MKDEPSYTGDEETSSGTTGQVSVDDVLITAELARRPTRSPDYEAENRAHTVLAEAMADSPQTVLQKLVEAALNLCCADSAGIRMLEPGGAAGVLRWHAVAGQLQPDIQSHVPREASPSRIVLDRDTSLLFSHPERYFDYGRAIDPPIVEALLVPFHNEGKPVGTLWVIAHTPARKFDTEDQRLLTSLSRFASMAYQVKTAALTAVRAKEDVRQILDTAAIGLTRCSRDLRYLACNRAYEKLIGLPADQVIGRPIIDVMGAKAFEVIRPYVERVLRGERVEFEEEVPISAGGPRFFHVVLEPWFDSEGRVTGWIASVSETTDLKRTTTALRESEERDAFLLRLADTLRPLSDPVAIQEVTARLLGEHLHVNRVGYSDIEGTDYIIRLSHVNGVAPMVGRGSVADFGEWLLESHRSGEPIVVNDVSTDPRFTESELSHFRASEIAAFVMVMLVKDGQWVAAFGVHDAMPRAWKKTEVELIRDVAERIWEAVERARAEAALREREQLLVLSLDAAAAGVWTWDRFTNQCRWADRFHAQYGLGPTDPQTFDTWISRVHEEDRPRVLGHLDDVLRGRYNDWNVIFRAVRPDGTLVWMHGLGRADHGPDGQVTRISGINLDITERRRAEEALQTRRDEERDRALHKQAEEVLRRSHTELEQRTRQLRRLASQLTLTEQSVRRQLASTLHDGLQQLLFSAAMTLDEVVKSNPQDDQAELIQRARADLKEAMEAARTLSVNLFPPVLHLGGLPAALTWLARRTQEQYGIPVNVTADPQANPEASDVRVLLFEAVRELLFNAVKHAHVDRVYVELAVAPDDTIHIQVSDDGVGFDPTITLRHTNQQGGLGLFSIRERLALLGGHLHIQSAPGSGSRFTLTLPRSGLLRATDGAEAPQQDTAWQEHVVYDSASGTSKSLRILITDDHAVALAGLRELLGKRPSLQVVGEATNGIEAITQAVALQPDIIVMDVSMPQMNGIDATREIHRTLPHIRIVGLSTHHDESTEGLMRSAGAEAYFTKNEGTDRLLDYLLSVRAKAKEASRS